MIQNVRPLLTCLTAALLAAAPVMNALHLHVEHGHVEHGHVAHGHVEHGHVAHGHAGHDHGHAGDVQDCRSAMEADDHSHGPARAKQTAAAHTVDRQLVRTQPEIHLDHADCAICAASSLAAAKLTSCGSTEVLAPPSDRLAAADSIRLEQLLPGAKRSRAPPCPIAFC